MASLDTARSSATSRVATPTAFPDAGIFGVTQRVTLLCATAGAVIHYTIDGSFPTVSSPVFDPYTLPVLEAINDGDRGVTSTYTIKALATKDGLDASEVATFAYTIARRSKDVYLTHELHPGIHLIRDFDDTKMVLIIGSERAMLLDAGLGTGDLRGLVERMIGNLPLDVVITHAHPDHIALMGQFQGRYNVYMNHLDLPLLANFIQQLSCPIDLDQIIDLREGFTFDLGDCVLTVYEVPGHSAGSVVLFDEQHGLLFASDALGSNRPTIVDSLWMQFPGMAMIDVYLSTVQVFRAKVGGKIKETYGGHNDLPIYGETYLDNVQQAAQLLVNRGDDILVPSLRPTDVWQVVLGDRLTDPNWVAINVAKGACLTVAADKLATLSNLHVRFAALDAGFTPFHFNYTATVDAGVAAVEIIPTASSSRYHGLTINGVATQSGVAYQAQLDQGDTTFVINVIAPDGSATHTYTLVVTRTPA